MEPKPPEKITEKEVTKETRKALKKAGIFHWKNWSGPMTSPKGISDILGVYPIKVNDLVEAGIEEVGIFLAVELKRPGYKPTQDQKDFISNIRKSRGIAFYSDCPEKVIKWLGLFDMAHPLFDRGKNILGRLFGKQK